MGLFAFLIDASYLVAAFLFVFGLKRMSSPVTARSGIVVAGWGMVLAVAASLLYAFDVREAARPLLHTNVILALVALALGSAWAWWSGKRVAMTAMPQMVALYNGMGGGAAAAIAVVELLGGSEHGVFIGVLLGAGNAAGGYVVTERMLQMFKSSKGK